MDKLKPCPFCGGDDIKLYSHENTLLHGFIHLCQINGDGMVKIESRLFETEEAAVDAWNRRMPPDAPNRP